MIYERPSRRQWVAAWIVSGVLWTVLFGIILLLFFGCGAIPAGAINPYCFRNCWSAPVAITGNQADQLNPTLGDTAATATKTTSTTTTEQGQQ